MKRLTGILLALAAVLPAPAAEKSTNSAYAPRIGMQSWTLRNMNLEPAVDFCARHKIQYVQLIDKHFSPEAQLEDMTNRKALLDKKGLNFYTFGVARTTGDYRENKRLFDFAKFMGIKMIIVEPNTNQWDVLEDLVKEYDIRLAIHNHGIDSTYGNPATVKQILAKRDKRIGVCLDVGHVTGAGFDAAKVFREYEGRVFDIHLKDKRVDRSGEKPVILDVEIGKGDANFKGLFEELRKSRWDGVLAIETDNPVFANKPEPYVAAALEFVRQHFPPAVAPVKK